MTTPTDPTPDQTDPTPATPIENPLPAWARKPKGSSGEMTDESLAEFIGAKWETYKRKLAVFREDPSFVPTWNWSAFFVPTLWFLHRKLYLAFIGFVVLPQFALLWITGTDQQLTARNMMLPENRWLLSMSAAVELSSRIAAGGIANWLLFRRARAAIRLVALQSIPEPEARLLLRRIGGVNRTGVAVLLVIGAMVFLATLRA